MPATSPADLLDRQLAAQRELRELAARWERTLDMAVRGLYDLDQVEGEAATPRFLSTSSGIVRSRAPAVATALSSAASSDRASCRKVAVPSDSSRASITTGR
ncbi:MAG: hypothetical protein NVS3B26_22760 [Mycobacteriales bacterium]